MDIDFFNPTIGLGLIGEVGNYYSFDDHSRRLYLDRAASELRAAIILPVIEARVRRDMKMNVLNADANSGTENASVRYHSLLRRYEVSLILKENEKPVVHDF